MPSDPYEGAYADFLSQGITVTSGEALTFAFSSVSEYMILQSRPDDDLRRQRRFPGHRRAGAVDVGDDAHRLCVPRLRDAPQGEASSIGQ
jgi:hypothetical protein